MPSKVRRKPRNAWTRLGRRYSPPRWPALPPCGNASRCVRPSSCSIRWPVRPSRATLPGIFYTACARRTKPSLPPLPMHGCSSAALSPDGKLLAGGCTSSALLWDFATGKLLHNLKGHQGNVNAVVFSRDSKTLISGGDDKQIRRWDVDTGSAIANPLLMAGMVRGLDVHPDGKWLVAAAPGSRIPRIAGDRQYINGEVVLWNLETAERKTLLRNNAAGVWPVAFSPDGKLVAAGTTYGSNVRVWETATGKNYANFRGNNIGWVHCLTFSHDGKYLAFGSANHKVYLCDVTKKTVLHPFEGHLARSTGVSFSPNDKLLAASSNNGVRVWDVESRWGQGSATS